MIESGGWSIELINDELLTMIKTNTRLSRTTGRPLLKLFYLFTCVIYWLRLLFKKKLCHLFLSLVGHLN